MFALLLNRMKGNKLVVTTPEYGVNLEIRMFNNTRMKNFLHYFILILISFTFSGCELAGDIFKTGFYSGIFLVALIVALIIFVIARLSRKK